MKRVRIHMSGKVQGVFFRASTQAKARELSIRGCVRNLADGRVEIIAQAESEVIVSFLDWCRIGPSGAVVSSIDVIDEPFSNEFNGFGIDY